MAVAEVEYDRSKRTPSTIDNSFRICGLNVFEAREIRKKLEKGCGINELALEYNVEYKAITNVRDGRIFGNAK